MNKSPIPILITFNVDGAEHLSITPSEVLLENMDSEEVKVTYSASKLGTFDGVIRVEMDTVGVISEISVVAKLAFINRFNAKIRMNGFNKSNHIFLRCCVPQIEPESRRIEIEHCFFNHPTCLKIPLKNSSKLPAKFSITTVESTDVLLTPTSLKVISI